jgi:glycosyltransferase involved in cell wall biosynthesis
MHNTKIKVAIVYDWIDKWGGVERVLLHLHTLFPQAVFFTSAVSYKTAAWAKRLTVKHSFLQTLPQFIRSNRALIAPLFPYAFESFTFDEFNLVISVTSSFAKGIITKPETHHICYLLTPPRYLWSHEKEYLSGIKGFLARPALNHLRKWDIVASKRPDAYISISNTTSERAEKYYHISTPVVYPPFNTNYWDGVKSKIKKPSHINTHKPYYLWIGRMEGYKKPNLIIEAAKQLRHSDFILVGTGALENELKKVAPQNCQFAGLIPDNELSYLYTNANALIMPQNEDFGYTSLEAQYHGCPVIAFRGGGARETIQEGVGGMFFNEQTVASLVSQLERFKQISYNLKRSTQQGCEVVKERFGVERFNAQFAYQLQQHISL